MSNNLKITVSGGFNKNGEAESLSELELHPETSLAVIGPTGSGKSEFLSDIEQSASKDTPSGRTVIIDSEGVDFACEGSGVIAQLSQKMSFIMDGTVERFLNLHAESRNKGGNGLILSTLEVANTLCGEPIRLNDPLHGLSGGQSRALMIADIALISDAPVVLIDEIENAGINKLKALSVLSSSSKLVIIATHDPLLILMADRRLIMKNGGMESVAERTESEKGILEKIKEMDRYTERVREDLRFGVYPLSSAEAVL